MKKTLFIALFFLIFYPISANQNKTYIELYGAYDQITMSDYNRNQADLQTIYDFYGIDASFSRMDSAVIYEINYIYNLESTNAGLLGVYFRGGRLNAASTSQIKYTNGATFESINADYSVYYAGFGLRKYIASFFIGVDACGYFNPENTEKDTIYYPSGATYLELEKTWPTAIYGVNFETGVDMWLNDSFGISFRGGYRLAKGKITIDWGPLYDNEKTEQTVDYSGYFIGAGILIGLGDGQKKETKEESNW